MAISERIAFIRNIKQKTKKWLGLAIGASEKNAENKISQFESGIKIPKSETVTAIASALEISPEALNAPNLDSYNGIMHTLFAMEDLYGLKIDKINGEVCIRLDHRALIVYDLLTAWNEKAELLRSGKITREEYDNWRYAYPGIRKHDAGSAEEPPQH